MEQVENSLKKTNIQKWMYSDSSMVGSRMLQSAKNAMEQDIELKMENKKGEVL